MGQPQANLLSELPSGSSSLLRSLLCEAAKDGYEYCFTHSRRGWSAGGLPHRNIDLIKEYLLFDHERNEAVNLLLLQTPNLKGYYINYYKIPFQLTTKTKQV